jgi:hypothetical protein
MREHFVQRLWFGLLILFVPLAGCGRWRTEVPASPAETMTTGSLGRYDFASRAKVTAFNSEVKEWLFKRGFSPVTNETSGAIVQDDEWKKPGLLLRWRHDSHESIYVFIPECYHPESNVQIIRCHCEFQGSVDEIARDEGDFAKLRTEFLKMFPPTSELNE